MGRTLTEHGLDYQTEFVCGPRICKALHCISFDREDPQERARAEAAFRHPDRAVRRRRLPARPDADLLPGEAMRRLPQLRQVTGRIKAALDPDGVIAPGKYGIA